MGPPAAFWFLEQENLKRPEARGLDQLNSRTPSSSGLGTQVFEAPASSSWAARFRYGALRTIRGSGASKTWVPKLELEGVLEFKLCQSTSEVVRCGCRSDGCSEPGVGRCRSPRGFVFGYLPD